jgi:hypothetical protein
MDTQVEESPVRGKLVWDETVKGNVVFVEDPEGDFLVKKDYIRYRPYTSYDRMRDHVKAGKFPISEDLEPVKEWIRWTQGISMPGMNFTVGGVHYKGPDIHIVERWDYDGCTCPRIIVLDGVQYNIPRPPDPDPSDESVYWCRRFNDGEGWGEPLPLGGFGVKSPMKMSTEEIGKLARLANPSERVPANAKSTFAMEIFNFYNDVLAGKMSVGEFEAMFDKAEKDYRERAGNLPAMKITVEPHEEK